MSGLVLFFAMEFLRSAWAFAFSFSLAFSFPENGSVFAIWRKVLRARKNRLHFVSGSVFAVLVVARCHAQKYFSISAPIKGHIVKSKHFASVNIVCKLCAACVFQFVQGYVVCQEIGGVFAVAVVGVVAEFCIYKTAVGPGNYFSFAHCKRSYIVFLSVVIQNSVGFFLLQLSFLYSQSVKNRSGGFPRPVFYAKAFSKHLATIRNRS